MNTSLKLKRSFWKYFITACKSQWIGGGKRYALTEDKEHTDVVCEVAGNEWIGGNIIKYVGEIINTKKYDGVVPEVNFFKIAVYAFIWWLKELGNFTQRDKGEEFAHIKENRDSYIDSPRTSISPMWKKLKEK